MMPLDSSDWLSELQLDKVAACFQRLRSIFPILETTATSLSSKPARKLFFAHFNKISLSLSLSLKLAKVFTPAPTCWEKLDFSCHYAKSFSLMRNYVVIFSCPFKMIINLILYSEFCFFKLASHSLQFNSTRLNSIHRLVLRKNKTNWPHNFISKRASGFAFQEGSCGSFRPLVVADMSDSLLAHSSAPTNRLVNQQEPITS